jgi:hypothetical protein
MSTKLASAEPTLESLRVGQLQLARDLDAALDRTGDGTGVRVDLEYALYRVPILRVGGEVEELPDPLHDQNLTLCFYLPYRVGVEVLEGNSTRCQRAPEGAEQSATRRGHQIIEGGVVGFDHFRAGSVVLGDLAVDAEEDRLFLDGEIGAPDPALHRLYPHPRDVGYIGHSHLLSALCSMIPRAIRVHASSRWLGIIC